MAAFSSAMPMRLDARRRESTGTPSSADSFSGETRSAAALGDVHHVQRDHQRPAHLNELADQIEVALKVAGIDDNDHHVGRPGIRAQAAQNFHRHLLVGRSADQAVGAGQIDNVDQRPSGSLQRPVFFSTVTPG